MIYRTFYPSVTGVELIALRHVPCIWTLRYLDGVLLTFSVKSLRW